jgi:hypothetical protein
MLSLSNLSSQWRIIRPLQLLRIDRRECERNWLPIGCLSARSRPSGPLDFLLVLTTSNAITLTILRCSSLQVGRTSTGGDALERTGTLSCKQRTYSLDAISHNCITMSSTQHFTLKINTIDELFTKTGSLVHSFNNEPHRT